MNNAAMNIVEEMSLWDECTSCGYMYKNSIVITSIRFPISLLSFCLIDLSIDECEIFKGPTTSVCGLMCALSFSDVSFTYVGALVFGA